MKKIFISCLLLCFSLSYFAQITIDRSDYITIGKEIPRVSFGFTDREGLLVDEVISDPLILTNPENAQTYIDTVKAYSPEEIDVNNIFENANIAIYDDMTGMFQFMNITDSKAELLGVSLDLGLFLADISLDQPLTLYNFPINYEDTYSQATSGSRKEHVSILQPVLGDYYALLSLMYDSIMIKIDIDHNVVFDEFGNMTVEGEDLVEGEYTYLKENKRMIMEIDIYFRSRTSGIFTPISETILGSVMEEDVFPLIDTAQTYSYWAKNNDYPIAELYLNPQLDSVYDIYLRYEGGSVGIGCPPSFQIENVIVYPNPATESVNFNLEKYSGCELQIFGLTGNVTDKIKINSGIINMDISGYRSGTYFYKVIDKKGSAVAGGKFIKN